MALLRLSDEEWWAVYEAVSGYVENGEVDGDLSDPDPNLPHARAVMERLDAVVASLAE